MKETKRTVLSQQNAFAFLLYIYRAGGSSKASYLQDVIPNYASIKSIGAQLEEKGLIISEVISGKNGHILYSLTTKGFQIAEQLDKADKIFFDELTDDYVEDHKGRIPDSLDESQKQ